MALIDWDEAFANASHIPGGAQFPAAWARAAAEFRTHAGGALDLPYGAVARARFDLFRPEGKAQGIVVFVHGGYWMRFDKSDWSHLAAGPLAAGWAVALPSYTLAPEARIAAITAEIAEAIAVVAEAVTGPIHLAGHSAGGHLVTRMACLESPLAEGLRARLGRVVSISGLHDLRPLRETAMNATLGLSAEEAQRESAALQRPLEGLPVTAWVGARERPEFLRQSALLAEAWGGVLEVAPGRHHFDVIDALCDPGGALTRLLVTPGRVAG